MIVPAHGGHDFNGEVDMQTKLARVWTADNCVIKAAPPAVVLAQEGGTFGNASSCRRRLACGWCLEHAVKI